MTPADLKAALTCGDCTLGILQHVLPITLKGKIAKPSLPWPAHECSPECAADEHALFIIDVLLPLEQALLCLDNGWEWKEKLVGFDAAIVHWTQHYNDYYERKNTWWHSNFYHLWIHLIKHNQCSDAVHDALTAAFAPSFGGHMRAVIDTNDIDQPLIDAIRENNTGYLQRLIQFIETYPERPVANKRHFVFDLLVDNGTPQIMDIVKNSRFFAQGQAKRMQDSILRTKNQQRFEEYTTRWPLKFKKMRIEHLKRGESKKQQVSPNCYGRAPEMALPALRYVSKELDLPNLIWRYQHVAFMHATMDVLEAGKELGYEWTPLPYSGRARPPVMSRNVLFPWKLGNIVNAGLLDVQTMQWLLTVIENLNKPEGITVNLSGFWFDMKATDYFKDNIAELIRKKIDPNRIGSDSCPI